MYNSLEELSSHLFEEASLKVSGKAQRLLFSKWPQVRDIAAQNAGHKSWGEHLLKLNSKSIDLLKETFQKTIHSVEGEGLNLTHFIDTELHFLLDPATKFKDLPLGKIAAKALLLEYNPQFVAEYRLQFQKVFETLHSLEIWHKRDPIVAQMLIGNLISFLPLFDFEDQSEISLLRYKDGKWQFVVYKLAYIPLIAGKINAYGLEPQTPDMSPILVFRSTPYPAAAGFLEAILSDFNPTQSIGEDIFEKGRPALDKWIHGKAKVECYGMSLGGALAYHAGHAYGEMLEVHAYVAPGIKREMSQIRGRGFFHQNDLIKLVGIHPESEHFEMFSVLTETDVNFIQAHAIPPGIEPTIVLKINPLYENRTVSRYLFSIAKAIVITPFWLPLVLAQWCLKTWRRFRE